MMRWLTTLPAHNYITDPEDETGDKSINKDLCAAAKNTYVNFGVFLGIYPCVGFPYVVSSSDGLSKCF